MRRSAVDRDMATTLAAVERDAMLDMADCVARCPGEAIIAAGLRIGPCGLIAVPDIPWPLFNRGMLVRSDTFAQLDLTSTLRWLKRHAAPGWQLQLPPAWIDERTGRMLGDAGLVRRDGSSVTLVRGRAPLPGAPVWTGPSRVIRQIGPEAGAAMGALLDTGFSTPLPIGRALAELPGRPGWFVYVALEDGVPVATGAFLLRGVAAWMGNGTTLPDHRGKGAQKALIRHRIETALSLGVQTITVEVTKPTGDQPEPGPSYRNLLQAGFRLAYDPAVYTLP